MPPFETAVAQLGATGPRVCSALLGTTFDVALDWRLSAGFRAGVPHRLPGIGYGHTACYAAVAAQAGNPKAVRAVGTACATNPLPFVIPCERVLRSDRSLGGDHHVVLTDEPDRVR
jgi:methylated-DNA-[protein]-cysteine S-methyltransferase